MGKDIEKIQNIRCLGISCAKEIQFPTYINSEKYDGDLRCEKCLSLMHISLQDGQVVKYSLKDDKSELVNSWETIAKLKAALEKKE